MAMKKFINDPATLTDELLEGMALAYGDLVELEGHMVINKGLATADRVTIVTYGGSGHEPAQCCYVGEGSLDIQVVGDIFAAPNPAVVFEAVKKADKGHGVLLLTLNHAGDMLCGKMVMKMVKKAGLNVHAHRCLSNDKIVYSFWFSHTLYEYDVNTGAIRKAVAKSRYLPDEKALSPFNRLNNRQTDGFDEACEMPYYRHFYYDKYRRVFYRFAYPPNKNDIKLNFVDYLFVGRNTASIMVLDEDLNVLSETLLPENCFNTSTTFINKDGLWISCNHMLNPGLDEDHLQFVRFELKTEN